MERIFTNEDDSIIREWYPQSPAAAAERLPNFTLDQIRQRAYKLKVRARIPWTMRQRHLLELHWGKPSWPAVMHELEPHSRQNIAKMANKLGLKARKQWKITEHRSLMEDFGYISKAALEEKYGVCYNTIRAKVRELRKNLPEK